MKDADIIKALLKLPLGKRRELVEKVKDTLYAEDRYLTVRQDVLGGEIKCQHCDSEKVKKFGFFQGRHRYFCHACGRTFTELTGTSIAGIKKKDKWEKFIKLMMDGKSIRDIAGELKVSTKTVFDWRHKVLSSFQTVFTKRFKGIVELDDAHFTFDQKGRKSKRKRIGKKKRGDSDQKATVVITSDRYNTVDMKLTKMGRIAEKDLKRVLKMDRFNKENLVLCSDRHPSIAAYFKKLNLNHKKIYANGGQYVAGKNGEYHVQTVNNLTGRFREFIKHNYKSVATKYLQNYLWLFQMNTILKKDKHALDSFLKFSLKDDRTIERYRHIEKEYQKFLRIK
jgi:transposase-like protein